jgi:1-deoxy-D-xylulose-5-phosphate synthase
VPLDQDLKPLEIGKAELLREGADGVLVALGSMVYPALEAAADLAKEGS